MSPEQETDLILFWFQEKARIAIQEIGEGYIIERFKKDNLDTVKIKLILQKLVNDKLIQINNITAAPIYQITHTGYYSNGYVDKLRVNSYQARLQTSILILGCLGTVSAGLYALKEMIQSTPYRLVLFSIFLSSICTGILLLLYTRYFQK